MRYAPVALAFAALLISTGASANVETTFPLHGLDGLTTDCLDTAGDVCADGTLNTNVGAGTATVWMLTRNYTDLAGVQTAFDFGGNALQFGLWDCQGDQLSAVMPMNPGGPTAGSIATAFNPIVGGATAVIGKMIFSTSGGAITQVESTFPNGCHVVDSGGVPTQVEDRNRGSVGVGSDGDDACEYDDGNDPTPVEATSWGSIKAQWN